MIYQGQQVLVTTLKNRDLVALEKGISSLNKEIVDIKYTAYQVEPCVVEYSALIITKV